MKDYTGRDEVIFQQALLLPAADRPAYLHSACADNAELRRNIERRLRAHDEESPRHKTTMPAAEDDEWPSAIPRPAVVGQKVGAYKLIEELGEGGGGLVFLAEQESPVRRRVALKIIKLGMDTEDVIARFEAERQALAMMDHPNIARVFDAGATPTGRPYFVMELVRGVPITQFCDDNKLPLTERLKLFVQVCNAVQHAHQKGIIHRDIKPSNILIAMHDGAPVPKIIDFGISKATGGRLTDKTYYTTQDQFVGTPAYMSPEQAEMTNLDVDTRSDIYSLGVLLYQLLTGGTPLDAHELRDAGIDEIRRRIREEEPRRPSVRLAELSAQELSDVAKAHRTDPQHLIAQVRGDLDWIVLHGLEKDRQRRYESASALAQDIQRYLDHEPVLASPPSTWYSLQKMVRRHRVIFAAVSAVAAALVLGLGAATWSFYNERAARQTAEAEKARADLQTSVAKLATAATQIQKHEVQVALARTDYLAALSLIQDDHAPEAVAHLVRALRVDPDNRPAAALLCSVLTMKNWLVPLGESAWQPPARGNQPGVRRGEAGAQLREQNSPPAGPANRGPADPLPGIAEITTDSAIIFSHVSTDGHRVLTVSADRTARLWDVATGQPVSEPVLHNGILSSGQIGADGRHLSTQSMGLRGARGPRGTRGAGGQEFTWDFTEHPALLMQLRESSPISLVVMSADGRRLLTLSENSTALRVLNAASGNVVAGPLKLPQEVRNAMFSPDGQRVLTLVRSGTQANGFLLQIWNADTGAPVAQAVLEEPAGGPAARVQPLPVVAFSPDNRRVLASFGRTIFLLDAASGGNVLPPWRLNGPVASVAFSPDGQKILTAAAAAQIWDAGTGASILEFAQEPGGLHTARFSPDGKLAVTATNSGLAQVWDAQNGEDVSEVIRHGEQNFSASFSPDGKRILTVAHLQNLTRRGQPANARAVENTARVWDAATGLPLSALMSCGENLKSAAFSADGRWVVTSAGPSRVWDAATGLAVSVPLPGNEALLSADGQRLYVLGQDGVVRVWPFSDRIGPEWILDLAETLARCRLDATGSTVFYAGKPLEELRRLAAQAPDADQPMVLWARRLLDVAPPAAPTGKN